MKHNPFDVNDFNLSYYMGRFRILAELMEALYFYSKKEPLSINQLTDFFTNDEGTEYGASVFEFVLTADAFTLSEWLIKLNNVIHLPEIDYMIKKAVLK